jgi:uncharacterized protein (DUF58 family)
MKVAGRAYETRAAAADQLAFVEVAQDDQVGLWVAGQVPHGPPQQRPALVALLLDAAIPDGPASEAAQSLKAVRPMRWGAVYKSNRARVQPTRAT